MKISLGVNGACGRMGLRVIDVAHADKEVTLATALEAPSHPLVGRDVGELAGIGTLGLKVVSELPSNTRLDVLIDFSTPQGTMAVLPVCVARRISLLIATTGHTPEQRVKIAEAAQETAVLHAPNTSLGVNVLMRLVRDAARMLRDRDFDIEIVERHHRFKKDAPSGTALALAKVLQG